MSSAPSRPDVLVLGAGLWGLGAAWAAASAGAAVLLVGDDEPSAGAVAAGMLSPWSEAEDDEHPLHDVMLEADAAWPHLAARLAGVVGIDLGYRRSGSLLVAARPEHLGAVRHTRSVLAGLGRDEPWLRGGDLRLLEPGLGPSVAGGLLLADEGQVDPRRLLEALSIAGGAAGVGRRHGRVTALRRREGDVIGCTLADGDVVSAPLVVVALGAGSSAVDTTIPVRPVKGQVLILGPRPGAPGPLGRIVRTPDVYLVPRADGRVVVGATVEEAADRQVTAVGVHTLLDEALHTVPELGELAYLEHGGGLRPATPDGVPAIGRTADGALWLTGGYRNGVMLLPLVLAAVGQVLAGRTPAGAMARLSPLRFETQEAQCALS